MTRGIDAPGSAVVGQHKAARHVPVLITALQLALVSVGIVLSSVQLVAVDRLRLNSVARRRSAHGLRRVALLKDRSSLLCRDLGIVHNTEEVHPERIVARFVQAGADSHKIQYRRMFLRLTAKRSTQKAESAAKFNAVGMVPEPLMERCSMSAP